MKRFFYSFLKRLSAIRHWLRSHISRSGLLFLVMLLFSAAIGIDTRQNTVSQFFAILAVLGSISLCFCIRFTARISVIRHLPDFVTAGDPFRYRTLLKNNGQKTLRNIQAMDTQKWHYPTYPEFCNFKATGKKRAHPFSLAYRWGRLIQYSRMIRGERQHLPKLSPGTATELWQECTPLRRGIIRFDSVTFAKSDPFGLFHALSSARCMDTLIVLPKRYQVPPVQFSGSRKYQPSGVALASSVGESQEFRSMRDYRPGDPPRTIHWRSWAKTGKPW